MEKRPVVGWDPPISRSSRLETTLAECSRPLDVSGSTNIVVGEVTGVLFPLCKVSRNVQASGSDEVVAAGCDWLAKYSSWKLPLYRLGLLERHYEMRLNWNTSCKTRFRVHGSVSGVALWIIQLRFLGR